MSVEVARDEFVADSVLPPNELFLFVFFPDTPLLCAGFDLPERDVLDAGLRAIVGVRIGVLRSNSCV